METDFGAKTTREMLKIVNAISKSKCMERNGEIQISILILSYVTWQYTCIWGYAKLHFYRVQRLRN